MLLNNLKKNIDILIPWIFILISFLFFYPLNIFFILIFPITIVLYKNSLNIKKYRTHNLKTEINFYLGILGIFLFVLVPIGGEDYLYNSYQKNVIFSCYNLNRYSEEDFINNTHTWYKSEYSLPLLLDKVQECHTVKATPFLIYLMTHSPHTSNIINDFHAMGARDYGNQPLDVFFKIYPKLDKNTVDYSNLSNFIFNFYKKNNPNFNYKKSYDLIFNPISYPIIYDK
jgi:energy-coupling factor transporter transmembrane protein EcfT